MIKLNIKYLNIIFITNKESLQKATNQLTLIYKNAWVQYSKPNYITKHFKE